MKSRLFVLAVIVTAWFGPSVSASYWYCPDGAILVGYPGSSTPKCAWKSDLRKPDRPETPPHTNPEAPVGRFYGDPM